MDETTIIAFNGRDAITDPLTDVLPRNIHRPADLGAKVLLSGGSSTS